MIAVIYKDVDFGYGVDVPDYGITCYGDTIPDVLREAQKIVKEYPKKEHRLFHRIDGNIVAVAILEK